MATLSLGYFKTVFFTGRAWRCGWTNAAPKAFLPRVPYMCRAAFMD